MPKAYPKRDYLVENLLPLHSVNLLSGPSGGGKTRILFQWIEEALLHNTFAGRAIVAEAINPYYICFDRPIEALHDLLNGMGMYFSFPMEANLKDKTLPEIPSHINLLIIDGIDVLPDNMNDFTSVSETLRPLTEWSKANNCCVLGLLGNTKFKLGSHYASVRDRIAGSSAWSRFSELIASIEPLDPEVKSETRRLLSVDPRCSAPFNIYLETTEGGRLIPFIPPSQTEDILAKLPQSFSRQDITALAGACSDMTIQRLLKKWISSGSARKLSHGAYEKVS